MTNSRWKTTTIQEFVDRGEAEVKTGPFGTQMHASDYVKEGTPVINVRNIGFGSVVPEKLEYIGQETIDRLKGHLLRTNDIVFGRKGAVERHALIRDQQDGWFQGSDCIRLRIRSPELSPIFLSYSFLTDSHQKWMMNQCSHGVTMASLNQDIVCRIPLRFPDVRTQNTISGLLSAYDDLIENNTRRIEIVEDMASMIYREWFMNFRFPGHVNAKMAQSSLGLIPMGWEVRDLDQLMDFQGGAQPPRSEWADVFREGFVRMIQIRDYQSDSYMCFVKDSKNLRKCTKDDIMIARYGASVARICEGLEGAYNVALVRVVPEKAEYREFLRSYLKSEHFQRLLISMSGRTAQAGFNKTILNSIQVAVPKDAILMSLFQRICDPIRKLVQSLREANRKLIQTRDLVLPKLISGEVNVESLETETANQIS